MEILNEVSKLLEQFPSLAVWILVGVLFYKVFWIGSVFGIMKVLIDRLYSAFKLHQEKPIPPKIVRFADNFIVSESVYLDFLSSMKVFKGSMPDTHQLTMFHDFHVEEMTKVLFSAAKKNLTPKGG